MLTDYSDRYLKQETKNVSNSLKIYIDFLTENVLFVCFCKLCAPRLMRLVLRKFARGELTLIQNFASWWASLWYSSVCPGQRVFQRQWNFTAKTDKVPGKPGLVGHSGIQNHWSASVHMAGSLLRLWGSKLNSALSVHFPPPFSGKMQLINYGSLPEGAHTIIKDDKGYIFVDEMHSRVSVQWNPPSLLRWREDLPMASWFPVCTPAEASIG